MYRTLGEGRWTISVSGNGALTLSKNESAEPSPLVAAPPVRTYEQELAAMNAQVEAIGFQEVARSALGLAAAVGLLVTRRRMKRSHG